MSILRRLTAGLLGVAAFASLLPTTGLAAGQIGWAPPTVFPALGNLIPAPTVAKEFIKQLRLGNMNIVLEQTPLADVQRRLGVEAGKSGDASEFVQWICVQSGDAKRRWALWLESGEIDGGNIGIFEWVRIPSPGAVDARCRTLPSKKTAVRLPVALRLGDTEAHVISVLGQPTLRVGDSLLYLHKHEQTIQRLPYTTLNDLVVVVHRGVVDAVEVTRSTTS
jgi:hypothetical protein